MTRHVSTLTILLGLTLPVGPSHLAGQIRTGGSMVPCAVPLTWRIARVDPEFGIEADDVESIVARAGSLWENAVGSTLFRHDPVDGFPIRLVYDERLQGTLSRREADAELSELRSSIEEARAELDRRSERHAQALARHEERLQDFERRLAGFNATVRDWNENGGAPRDVALELRSREAAFTAERSALEAEQATLNEEARQLRDAQERLQRRVNEHDRRAERAVASGPPPHEAGEYREAVREEDGEVVSVSREIRIYDFASERELVVVAAHELGHALGLEHAADADAIMSAEYTRRDGSVAPRNVHPADLELLRATCPALVP